MFIKHEALSKDLEPRRVNIGHICVHASDVGRIEANSLQTWLENSLLKLCTIVCILFRDFLKVTNEKNETVGVYCGHLTGKTVHITGKVVVLTFQSGSAIQAGGFSLEFFGVSQGKFKRNSYFYQ